MISGARAGPPGGCGRHPRARRHGRTTGVPGPRAPPATAKPSRPCAACSRTCYDDTTRSRSFRGDWPTAARRASRRASRPSASVLVHMLREVRPDIPVLFLDTVHHFPETLTYRDRIAAAWHLNLVNLRAAEPEPGLWKTSTKACCGKHKVGPLFARARRLRHVVHRPPARPVSVARQPGRHRAVRAAERKVAPQSEPARRLDHEGRLGVRQGPRHPPAAALRAGLHEHRLRAVHVAADRPVQSPLRPMAGPEARVRDPPAVAGLSWGSEVPVEVPGPTVTSGILASEP